MNSFLNDGYQIIRQAIEPDLITTLIKAIAQYDSKVSYGIRDLHQKIVAVNKFASSNLILDRLNQCTNYQKFRLIKAIFFNKDIQHNWAVPWHQDKTIVVKQKVILSGYQNWTVKQGVHHVQPPRNILEKITTIRIALDDCNSKNGTLKLVPRSHQLGILNQQQINRITRLRSPVICDLKAGDILIMHPLILHSSGKSINGHQRRTIHLEYSDNDLPASLVRY